MLHTTIKKLTCFLIILSFLIPVFPVHASQTDTWTLETENGNTITNETYKDKVQLLIFFDPSLNDENDPADANTKRMLDRLLTSGWLGEEGLQVILVPAGEAGNAFWAGRSWRSVIERAKDGSALLEKLNTKNEALCFCAIYKDGRFVETWGNCSDDEECFTHLSKYLPGGQVTYFDVKIPVTYMQTEARKMLQLINDFRTGEEAWYWNEDDKTKTYCKDLKKLVWDYDLEKVAMQRAVEIAFHFHHLKADGTYEERTCQNLNYPVYTVENIACRMDWFPTGFQGLFEESSYGFNGQGHRRQMLSEHVAFAAAIVEYRSSYYGVQMFSGTAVNTVKTAVVDKDAIGTVRAWSKTVTEWTAEITPFTVTAGTSGKMSDHVKLTAHSITPQYTAWSDETRNTLQWSSDHPEIVTASGNTFTALSGGTAILSARTPDLKKTITCKVTVLDDPKESKTENTMYRLYNPNTGEHFYTAKAKERNALVSYGWQYEGVGWIAPKTSNTPVYRLYNSNAGDHHYTMNKKERDALIKAGWKDEGTGWYSDDKKTVPLYREYNPNMQKCNHNYTTNKKEHDYLTTHGWNNEGIGWYGINK